MTAALDQTPKSTWSSLKSTEKVQFSFSLYNPVSLTVLQRDQHPWKYGHKCPRETNYKRQPTRHWYKSFIHVPQLQPSITLVTKFASSWSQISAEQMQPQGRNNQHFPGFAWLIPRLASQGSLDSVCWCQSSAGKPSQEHSCSSCCTKTILKIYPTPKRCNRTAIGALSKFIS